MTAWVLWAALASAHTPQVGRLELVLDRAGVGRLSWSNPRSGPAVRFVPLVPDGCEAGPVGVRADEEAVASTRSVRCAPLPGDVGLADLDDGGLVVASLRLPGGTVEGVLGPGGRLATSALPRRPPPPAAGWPVWPLGGLLVALAVGALRRRHALPAHLLGVVGAWLLVRTLWTHGG